MTRDTLILTRALSRAIARELVRDRAAMVVAVAFPPALLGMIAVLAHGTSGAGDPLAFALPGILVFGFVGLAVHGTAAPLVTLRMQGTLRLLAITPVSRLVFVLAQMPVRFALAGLQLALALPLAVALGDVKPSALPVLSLALVLALWLLVALGFLAGGLLRSPELVTSGLGVVMPVVLLLSGVFIPLGLLPGMLRAVAHASPVLYLTDAIRHGVDGSAPTLPLGTDLIVSAVSAATITVLAAVTFNWEQGDPV